MTSSADEIRLKSKNLKKKVKCLCRLNFRWQYYFFKCNFMIFHSYCFAERTILTYSRETIYLQ